MVKPTFSTSVSFLKSRLLKLSNKQLKSLLEKKEVIDKKEDLVEALLVQYQTLVKQQKINSQQSTLLLKKQHPPTKETKENSVCKEEKEKKQTKQTTNTTLETYLSNFKIP